MPSSWAAVATIITRRRLGRCSNSVPTRSAWLENLAHCPRARSCKTSFGLACVACCRRLGQIGVSDTAFSFLGRQNCFVRGNWTMQEMKSAAASAASSLGVLQERLNYIRLDQDSLSVLRSKKSLIDQELQTALDRFYKIIEATPAVRSMFADPARCSGRSPRRCATGSRSPPASLMKPTSPTSAASATRTPE